MCIHAEDCKLVYDVIAEKPSTRPNRKLRVGYVSYNGSKWIEAIQTLSKEAEVVDLTGKYPGVELNMEIIVDHFMCRVKEDMNDYLATLESFPVKTMEDIVQFNKDNAVLVKLETYDQSYLEKSLVSPTYRSNQTYCDEIKAKYRALGRTGGGGIDTILDENKLDLYLDARAIVSGTAGLAGYPASKVLAAGVLVGVVVVDDGGAATLIHRGRLDVGSATMATSKTTSTTAPKHGIRQGSTQQRASHCASCSTQHSAQHAASPCRLLWLLLLLRCPWCSRLGCCCTKSSTTCCCSCRGSWVCRWVARWGRVTALLWWVSSRLLWGVSSRLLWGVTSRLLWGITTLRGWVAALAWRVVPSRLLRRVAVWLLLLLWGVGALLWWITTLFRGVCTWRGVALLGWVAILLWGIVALRRVATLGRGVGSWRCLTTSSWCPALLLWGITPRLALGTHAPMILRWVWACCCTARLASCGVTARLASGRVTARLAGRWVTARLTSRWVTTMRCCSGRLPIWLPVRRLGC